MKPLLAETVVFEKLQYPVLVSPKFDGFRCLIHPGLGPVTRSLKPIANNYVRGKLDELKIPYLDGELLTVTNGKIDDFNTVQSKLSTRAGMPDFIYMVFDDFQFPNKPFTDRVMSYAEKLVNLDNNRVGAVIQNRADNEDELNEMYARHLELGWEGSMLRSLDGRYKFGRSTVNEGILLKLKPEDEGEGLIVGQYERMHNANEAKTNALGATERSSHKENMVGTNSLGGYTIAWKGLEFDLGTGFTESQRVAFWTESRGGAVVTFAYQGVGPNGKPRFPRFRGFRHDL